MNAMKVLTVLVLVTGYVSARGSGPYLPRGWKPDGPAFYLPSEVAKPAPAPVQVSLFQETEASGSDAFREYGPPKLEEVSVSVNQVLPAVATEQTFLVEGKNEETVAAVQETINAEGAVAAIVEVESTATESQAAAVEEQAVEELATETFAVEPTVGTQSLDIQDQVVQSSVAVELEEVKEEVVPTAAVEEAVPTVAEEAISTAAEVVEEVVPTVGAVEAVSTVVEEVVPTAEVVEAVPAVIEEVAPTVVAEKEATAEVVVPLARQELVQEAAPSPAAEAVVEQVAVGVQNIAAALVTLEKEVKAVEVQAIANVAEITSIQEASGSLEQGPEGFLEYGPPGFAEYGPPKQEDLARLAVEGAVSAVDNNEVRRRRFSPKFRTTKKH